MRALMVLLGVLLPAACTGAPPGPPVNTLGPAELTRVSGCGDAFVYATNGENNVAVVIEWPAAASRAQQAGQFEASATLPADEVSVRIQFGPQIGNNFCTDIVEPGMPRIVAEAAASAGEVEISVVPQAGAEPFMPTGSATVRLTDIVFEVPVEGTVEIWRIDEFELPNVQVGWLAG